mgnify:CR=1 FL=1
MPRHLILCVLCLALAAAGGTSACEDEGDRFDADDDDGSSDGDADGDVDADADADTDADTGPIEPDCSGCNGIGATLPDMICAVDLCDETTVIDYDYTSPTNSTLAGTAEAVAHFGDSSNDLAPLLNGSYALMATGPATGTSHSQDMGGGSMPDPFANDGYDVHNAFEWKIDLKAPPGAHGIQIHYVFFSEEYDDFVGTSFNDKFYIFLEAQSTNGGQKTVINYTDCRDPGQYMDFSGPECDTASGTCCYIAINTSLSECCWYDGCPQGTWTTSIAGTGFECADSQMTDGSANGSSTGWLKTEWPVEPGEELTLTFHIHDTSDGIYDSEVILDKILFVGSVEQGTTPVY